MALVYINREVHIMGSFYANLIIKLNRWGLPPTLVYEKLKTVIMKIFYANKVAGIK